jgi:hypothetical protein
MFLGELATLPCAKLVDRILPLKLPNVGWLKTFKNSDWNWKRNLSLIGKVLESEVSLNVWWGPYR